MGKQLAPVARLQRVPADFLKDVFEKLIEISYSFHDAVTSIGLSYSQPYVGSQSVALQIRS
jgi:hypothetical protein